jgi:hypothetical protein
LRKSIGIIGLFFTLLLLSFTFTADENLPEVPEEKEVIKIVLTGPLADTKPEVSGLAWYKDDLILLPQNQELKKNNPGNCLKLYTIPKDKIKEYLKDKKKNKNPPSITPREIDFIIEKTLCTKIVNIKGFEGFEAIAFWENKVFMTIEASPDYMLGYLVSGEVDENADGSIKKITLKHRTRDDELVKIQPQACIPNMAYETLLVTEHEVIALYEANGKEANASPLAYVYDHDLNFIKAIAFPPIEYRITDATDLDRDGRFWCINFFYPGDKELKPEDDGLAKKYGSGKTHKNCKYGIVERLVEFEYKYRDNCLPGKIVLVDKPPIQLELMGCDNYKKDSRNWEGIVRLDDPAGFLLITDEPHDRSGAIFDFIEF